MERDVARRSREARDEFNQRRNEEVLLLQGRAGRIIQQIAESEKFDLVLYEFFYASPKVDITDRVMKALDADVKPAKKKKEWKKQSGMNGPEARSPSCNNETTTY